MSQQKRSEEPKTIEEFILEQFEANFHRLKFESGHGLAPEVREAAKRQVLLYWKRLKEIANTITDTEVRLNLPGQESPQKRKFNIEGVVDIVRSSSKTSMYDVKTHDPEYVHQNITEYEHQLNVYAHIWHNLRGKLPDETAVIATQLPESVNKAWENREQDPTTLDQELQKWNPVIPIPIETQHVQDTIQEFGQVVDRIESGKHEPVPIKKLKEKDAHNRIFATQVCRNCDARFSCGSYREYVKTSKSRDLPRFKEIFEDTGTEEDRQVRMSSGLEDLV